VQIPIGTQGVSQCFGCGVVGEGEEDNDDGNFYCFTCWLVFHAARAFLWRDSHTFNRNTTFRVYLVHLEVRSMIAAFRMYLLHLDNDLSCSGPARARNVAPFRMHLLYLNSVPDESAHRSPREEQVA
jgi:hypothetical protein